MNNLMLVLLYGLSIALTIYYFYIKFKRREYIFSFYTITILIFAFTLFIIGPLQYKLEAWSALGIVKMERVLQLYPALNKIYIINLLGFSIYLIALIYFEFKDNNKVFSIINKSYFEINYQVLIVFFYLCIILWYSITLTINKTLPILNQNRLFIEEYGLLKPIYLGLNSIIVLCGTVFIINCITNPNKKDIFNICISLITILATGNRGPLIGMITTITMYCIYLYIKNKKLVLVIILGSLLGCVLLGFGMEFLRGSSVDGNLINSIAYGNTFSDIRDGAFVLDKYEAKYDGYLWGKNYIADFISFIPSGISQFRQKWSYGHFTTSKLFGWDNHYGLRGGWLLEPYINFSILCVIIIAIIYAYYTAGIENFFYKNVVDKQNVNKVVNGLLAISVIGTAFTSLTISSGFNTIYSNFAFVFANVLISRIINKRNRSKNV